MSSRHPRRTADPGSELTAASGGHISTDPGSEYLITVQIDPRFEGDLDADRLHRLAIDVLHAEGTPGPLELGVLVTTDDEVLALNRQYLNHDYKTDVLSFSMVDEMNEAESGDSSGTSLFISPPERPSYLGDIAISYDRAAEQGPEYGHDAPTEVATLLIHGLLHLLGYDDTEDIERERMHSRQGELLAALYGPH
jgi:probable rRNA maturation factor